jgi:hypothetical protein
MYHGTVLPFVCGPLNHAGCLMRATLWSSSANITTADHAAVLAQSTNKAAQMHDIEPVQPIVPVRTKPLRRTS